MKWRGIDCVEQLVDLAQGDFDAARGWVVYGHGAMINNGNRKSSAKAEAAINRHTYHIRQQIFHSIPAIGRVRRQASPKRLIG